MEVLMAEKVLLVPSANRMMGSMRDIGYDLPTSIADLVDNSIEADATEVWIDFLFKADASSVRIFDNGNGMATMQMDEALRYGSKRDYANDDLGKFGLGLKTASLSHCRKLSIASKQKGDSPVSIMMWDMDHVEASDAWEALRLSVEEASPDLLVKLKTKTGTVVLWEELDRVTTGSSNKETFASMCRLVEEHLGMVFHRFIQQKAKRKLPLTIYVNKNPIKSWDPFARGEIETRALSSTELKYEHNGKGLTAKIQPYILPPEHLFSSKSAHLSAAGPKKWNRQQGFYIYRNDRLIQSGGWSRLRAADEHTKLARVAVDFSSISDESFKINIAKMTVQIPTAIRKDLRSLTASVAAAANSVYRYGSSSKNKRIKTPSINKPDTSTPLNIGKQQPINIHNNSGVNTITTSDKHTTNNQQPDQKTIPNNPNFNVGNVFREVGGSSSYSSNDLVETVVEVLNRELSEDPELLRRVMIALAKHRPEFRSNGGDKY